MRAIFARKVATLAELKELTEVAIKKGQQGQPYTVIKEVHLSTAAFNALAQDFFEDQPWITNEDGGVNKEGQVRCIRVVNSETGEKVLINNEGYEWPRYTALETT